MQLSDLIKSKIDLYGLSFGIGPMKRNGMAATRRRPSLKKTTRTTRTTSQGDAMAKKKKATTTRILPKGVPPQ